jgi:hypothetical protein
MAEMRAETVREARRRGLRGAEPNDRDHKSVSARPAKRGGTERSPDPATGEHDLRRNQKTKAGSTGSSG